MYIYTCIHTVHNKNVHTYIHIDGGSECASPPVQYRVSDARSRRSQVFEHGGGSGSEAAQCCGGEGH